MNTTHKRDDEQAKLWNGPGGCAWVDAQESLDRMFQPFEDLLVDVVRATSRGPVLDVGCGTGATTLAVARLLGPSGRCVGIDISQPMITLARARAERDDVPAAFICDNAQLYAFEPASVDMIISRFGVMFFDDPIAAFGNLRRAARPEATLRCVAWRSPADNSFMTTAERAAAPLLPDLPARDPEAPGQFAFGNDRRVRTILEKSGWTAIDIKPLDVVCTLPERELNIYLTRLGPVGRILQDVDEATRAKIIATVRAAFDPFVHGDQVRYTAACWLISARA